MSFSEGHPEAIQNHGSQYYTVPVTSHERTMPPDCCVCITKPSEAFPRGTYRVLTFSKTISVVWLNLKKLLIQIYWVMHCVYTRESRWLLSLPFHLTEFEKTFTSLILI